MPCPRCHKEHDGPCRLIDLARANVSIPLDETPLVFLDVETTGFAPRTDRIVEISLQKVRGGEVLGAFDAIVDPQRMIPAAATAVHGIDMFAVMNRPPFAEFADEIAWFLGDQAVIVGHNVSFDLGFLNHELARAGRPERQWQGLSFCTLAMARNVYKFPVNKLGILAQKLGIEVEETHRAGKDVQTTIEVFDCIMQRIRPTQTPLYVRDVLRAQGGNVVAPLAGAPVSDRAKGGRWVSSPKPR